MTGREIVKAIECCVLQNCNECPYDGTNCSGIMKDVLDFINRLKTERNKYKFKAQNQKGHLAKLYKLTAGQLADLESLSMDLSSAIMEKDALLDMVEEQNAELDKKDTEIDILIRKKEALSDEISGLKTEIERLLIRNKTLIKITENYDWKFKKAKTEAIKEFAGRLKDEFVQGIRVYNGYASVKDISKNIDNLVKEMVGENNV